MDTLRRNHLGCYGHSRSTSPAIDAFAASAVRFDRAYATAPWTKPSIASIFTGLHPGGHGASGVGRVLSEKVTTLAEILSDQGWATAGFVTHRMLRPENGFHQGFDVYHDGLAEGDDSVTSPRLTSQAIAMLQRLVKSEEPFFLFVHYFDPHYTYNAHADIDFAPKQVGRLEGTESIHLLRRLAGNITSNEVAFLRDLYDEEVALTDRGIGQLLAELTLLGRAENTLVVLTADHGEEFFERGWIGHTRSLYEELVLVPLIIRDPTVNRPGAVVTQPVSLVSITPTVLDLLGVDASRYEFHGASLTPLLGGTEPAEALPAGPVLTEVEYRPARHEMPVKLTVKQAVIVGSRKLIRDGLTGNIELFDLAADPGEVYNLAATDPGGVAQLLRPLEAELARTHRGGFQGEARRLSAEERDQLRELGYLEPDP